jgi:hypothetical protein
MEWDGFTPTTFSAGQVAPDEFSLYERSVKFPESVLQLVVPGFIMCLDLLT